MVKKWPVNPWYQISYIVISRLNIPAYKIKILIIFKDCYNSRYISKQRNVFQKTLTMSERAQLASIEAAEIMKSKSHTLAESVILPACKKMVKSMLGETAEKDISKIPLSNDTIHRRILDLSENIDTNVQKKLEGSKFALIVDESTDISNSAQLLVFVRFINDDEIINQFFVL